MQNKLLAGQGPNPETITNPIFGQNLQNTIGANGASPTSFISDFIPKIISLLLVAGVVIFFFTFLIGAIQWISSGGDKQALEGAKGKITNALIGIIVLFSVFAVALLIETFFGISILTLDISKLVIQ